MLLCLLVQSLASLSVVMVLWNLEKSVTAAMLISAMTPAATTPTKGRARSANSNPAKSAGQICQTGAVLCFVKCYRAPSIDIRLACCLTFDFLLICHFYSTVPAKAHAAHPCALLRAQMRNADWSQSVPKRACATELPLCVLPQSQRKTSPHAIQKHKSASVGYVGFSFPFCCLRCSMYSVYFTWRLCFCSLLVWNSSALVPFVRSINWRYARVPLKMARMRQPSCATCAVWRKVSRRPQIAHGSECASKLIKLQLCDKWHGLGDIVSISEVAPPPTVNPSTCSSSGSDKWAKYFNNTVTTLQPGSPCNDFKGYCDVFMRCRLVDADGPLARLKKAIFNAELYENIAEWIVVGVPAQEMQRSQRWRAVGTSAHRSYSSGVSGLYLIMLSIYAGSLVGSSVDGHRSYYANGWLYQDLQCPYTKQQPQTAPTKATARYAIAVVYEIEILCFCHVGHIFSISS